MDKPQEIPKSKWNSSQIVQYFFRDESVTQVTKNEALSLITKAKELDFIVETGVLASRQNFLKVVQKQKTKKSDCVLECDCGFKTVSKEEFADHIQSHIKKTGAKVLTDTEVLNEFSNVKNSCCNHCGDTLDNDLQELTEHLEECEKYKKSLEAKS